MNCIFITANYAATAKKSDRLYNSLIAKYGDWFGVFPSDTVATDPEYIEYLQTINTLQTMRHIESGCVIYG